MTGFQTTMYTQPARGIEGDWASANPRFTQLSGQAPIFAGANGVTVGRFAWLNGSIVSNSKAMGGRIGFVHRDQPALIVPTGYSNWLPQSTMVVPPGLEVVLYDSCDVWCAFAAGATPGQKVYASYADGTAVAAATGSPASITASSFSVAADSPAMSMTGYIRGRLLTITAATQGHVYPGTTIAGSGGSNGVAVITGTQVVQQVTPLLSGETQGGVGRYLLNYDYGVSEVQSSTITGVCGICTITTTSATTWGPGLTCTASDAAFTITADASDGYGLTGAGGAGTYACYGSDMSGNTSTLTGATDVETNWYVDTYAASGELAKISTHG